jgi:ribosomal protein S24E
MDLKITKEEQNPLFNRKRVEATLVSNSAPKKQEVIEALSKKYSVPENALRILDIKGNFGSNEFIIRANVYPSSEERDNVEKLSKKDIELEKKKAEPAEKPESTEEKPAEETKEPEKTEEKPAEEKTPAEESIGVNPVEEAKKVEEKKQEEDKKEKEKTEEEKNLEK